MNRTVILLEERLSLPAVKAEILKRTRMHTEMVSRLLNDPSGPPAELGEFLEDVGNIYLDYAEEIARRRRDGRVRRSG